MDNIDHITPPADPITIGGTVTPVPGGFTISSTPPLVAPGFTWTRPGRLDPCTLELDRSVDTDRPVEKDPDEFLNKQRDDNLREIFGG